MILSFLTSTSHLNTRKKNRSGGSTECSYLAMLIFDEVVDCSGAGCPMRWRSKTDQPILVSNILQTAQTRHSLSCIHLMTGNIWNNRLNDRGNSEELFAAQYQLGASSTLFPILPENFRRYRSQIDYPTYQKLKNYS